MKRILSIPLFWLLLSTPAMADIAKVLDDDCDVALTDPIPCAYTTEPTAGHTLIVVIAWDNAARSISGVTDTIGNDWDIVQTITAAGGESVEIWCAVNTTTGANTVTLDFNGTIAAQVTVSSWSGGAATCTGEPTNEATVSTDTLQAGEVTPNSANNLVILGWRFNTAFSVSGVTADYLGLDGGGFSRSRFYYKIKTDSDAENPTVTTAASEDASGIVALFAPAAAASTCNGGIALLGAGGGC